MKRLSILLLCLLSAPAQAYQRGYWNAAAQSTVLVNSGSQLRAGAAEAGVLLSGDYLDDGGLSLGYTRTQVQFLQALPAVNQHALYLSARRHLYADSVAGRFTLRADGHRVTNDDATGLTDAVRAAAVQLAYAGPERQQYFDVGYARSSYGDTLIVQQYTPTVASALQQGAGWLQVRAYLIALSDAYNGIAATRALETKYGYWLTRGPYYKPDNLQFGALFGKRLFAADMDAGSLSNLSDMQTGGVALGAEWRLGKRGKLLLLGGHNRYLNPALDNSYRGNFLYLNVNGQW